MYFTCSISGLPIKSLGVHIDINIGGLSCLLFSALGFSFT
jgi:hypothetical protein